MSDLILKEQKGHVRVIQLNRAEKKNALSDELAWGIIEAVEEAAKDDDVWVIGLTSTGDTFCAGLDLNPASGSYAPLSPMDHQLDDLHWVGRFPLVLREVCDKPIVAGITGAAVGAGFALAMSSDIRIIGRSARLMAGYTRIGGSPDGGLSWTLSQALGYEQAMRFMLENKTVTGEEAVALGLAGEVVDDDKVVDRLFEYCEQIAQWSPITTRSIKRVIGKVNSLPDLEAHVRYELATIRRAFQSEDAAEARKAFFEKRTPQFHGK